MEALDLDDSAAGWSIHVQAQNDLEALEEAERLITWIDMSPEVASTAQHRMARFRLTDPEND